MVSVPVRSAPLFAATVNCTVPFDVPLVPAEIVMNAALLTAVQAHELAAVTAVDPVPPSGANVDGLGGPTENEHEVEGVAGLSLVHAAAASAANTRPQAIGLESVMRNDTPTV
jgi:hypothetical protein